MHEVLIEEAHLRHVGEVPHVAVVDLALAFNAPGQLLHLFEADHRLQLGELEIVADLVVNVGAAPGAAEILEPAQTVGDGIVIRDQRPALAGGDDLRRREGEGADRSLEPHMGAVGIARTEGLGAVLDQDQLMLGAEPLEGRNPGPRIATVGGDQHDRPRAWADRGPGGVDIHAQSLGFDIDEDRLGADHLHRIWRGDHGEIGDDHLVTGLDAGGQRREGETHGAVVGDDAVPGAGIVRNCLLEGGGAAEFGKKAVLLHVFGERAFLLLAEPRTHLHDELVTHRGWPPRSG